MGTKWECIGTNRSSNHSNTTFTRVSETGVLVLSVKSVKSTSTKSDSQIMGTFF